MGALEFAVTLPAGAARLQVEALAHHALGHRADADEALQQLVLQTAPAHSYRVAEVYAYRGDNDAAFEWLQRSVAAAATRCPVGDCWPTHWVPALPLLRPLQTDPRWPAIRTALAAPSVNMGRT